MCLQFVQSSNEIVLYQIAGLMGQTLISLIFFQNFSNSFKIPFFIWQMSVASRSSLILVFLYQFVICYDSKTLILNYLQFFIFCVEGQAYANIGIINAVHINRLFFVYFLESLISRGNTLHIIPMLVANGVYMVSCLILYILLSWTMTQIGCACRNCTEFG